MLLKCGILSSSYKYQNQACSLLVCCIQYVGNDSLISCIQVQYLLPGTKSGVFTQAGNSDNWPIPGNVMNTYCYIMSTFTLPNNFKHTIHPGVATRQNDNDPVRIAFVETAFFYAINYWSCRWSTNPTISGFPLSSSSRLASSTRPTSSSNCPKGERWSRKYKQSW